MALTTALDLGLHPDLLIAGFCGGVVIVAAGTWSGPYKALCSVVAGALTANYLAALAVGFYSGTPLILGAFVVGLTAVPVVQGIVAKVKMFSGKEKQNGG